MVGQIMGKGQKGKTKKKKKHNNVSGRKAKTSVDRKQSETIGKIDYLAVLPGLLMCLVIAVVLILDISMPEMSDKQYQTFQGLFRWLNLIAVISGLIVLASRSTLFFKEKKQAPGHDRKLLLHPYTAFAAFAVCILISTCINGFTDEALKGIPYRNIGIILMMTMLLVYMGVTSSIESDPLRKIILVAYLAISVAVALAALCDRYIKRIPAFHAKKELSAIFFNGNHYAYFLAMAILIGIGYYIFGNSRQAAAGASAAAVNMLVLVLNHTLGCILAVGVVMVIVSFAAVKKDRRYSRKIIMLWAFSAAAAAAVLVISPDIRREFAVFGRDIAGILSNTAKGSAGHNRLKMWRLTSKYIAERPWFGFGCEGISMEMYAKTAISNPHNEILTYAAYYGIPAAAFYTFGVLAVLVRRLLSYDSDMTGKIACMAAAGYFIASITGVAMFYTTPFFFVFLGISIRSLNIK